MRALITLSIIFLSTVVLAQPKGSLTCFYEISSKSYFDKPVVTSSFKLNLMESKYINTGHEYLNNIIRLHYNPASLDRKHYEHMNFSLTYGGAHAGAVVPMSNGRHIVAIAGDETDLAGAFLNCDVIIDK